MTKQPEFSSRVQFTYLGPNAGGRATRSVGLDAVCNACGLIYPSDAGLDIGGPGVEVHSVEIKGMPSGKPCPRCGGQGEAGGLFAVLEDAVLRMTSSGSTFDEVSELVDIFHKAARRRETDPVAIAEEVRRRVPNAEPVLSLFARFEKPAMVVFAAIAALMSVLTYWKTNFQPPPSTAAPHSALSPAAPRSVVELDRSTVTEMITKALKEEREREAPCRKPPTKDQRQKNRDKQKRRDRR